MCLSMLARGQILIGWGWWFGGEKPFVWETNVSEPPTSSCPILHQQSVVRSADRRSASPQ